MQSRRYPGVVSFTAGQQSIFFGRDNDIIQLQKYIRNRKSVILYSKSGIGKSSLLNAGVLPQVQSDFLSLSIRFYLYDENNPVSPVERVRLAIKPLIEKAATKELDKLISKSHSEKPLWYYFKQLQSVEKRKILLVFDQFEEFFSYPPEQRLKFKQELYEITMVDIPQNTLNYLVEKLKIETLKDFDFLRKNLDIHTLFAIRYDYLSHINELADYFPVIQENYYELKPLKPEQASEAIIKPAISQENVFNSPVFEIDKKALNHIIDVLTEQGKKAIETTILQLICIKLEEIAIEKHKQKSVPINIQIEDIPPFAGIFLRFYESSIEILNAASQPNAKKLIEDVLIRNGSRVSLDRKVCTDYLTNDEVNTLITCHLLRSEPNTTGGESIELCHDTIIEPILNSRNQRIEKEKIEEARLQANLLIRKRLKITLYVFLASLFILIVFFTGMLYLKNGELNNANLKLKETNQQISEAYQALSHLIEFDTTKTNLKPLKILITKAKQNSEEISNQLNKFTELSEKLNSKQNLNQKDLIEIAREYNTIILNIKKVDLIKKVQVEKSAINGDSRQAQKDSLSSISNDKPIKEGMAKIEDRISQKIENRLDSKREEVQNGEIYNEPNLASLQMAFMKGGEFMMGDNNSPSEWEKPAHKVFVSDFYIGKYEVTQKQWLDVMGSNPSTFKGCNDCPVENVSWNDVHDFIAKLNVKTGKNYRLPTEAEWEYAAGGGSSGQATTRTKWAGTNVEQDLEKYAWFISNGSDKTHPVGTKNPNSLGLCDMNGNVWEWCEDLYSTTYYSELKDKALTINPTGAKKGIHRVIRGGSWRSEANFSRVTSRSDNAPINSWDDNGFRLILSLQSGSKLKSILRK